MGSSALGAVNPSRAGLQQVARTRYVTVTAPSAGTVGSNRAAQESVLSKALPHTDSHTTSILEKRPVPGTGAVTR